MNALSTTHIDSFFTSNVEDNETDYSETLDLIGSACCYIKYKQEASSLKPLLNVLHVTSK